jgi:hypothetical protein
MPILPIGARCHAHACIEVIEHKGRTIEGGLRAADAAFIGRNSTVRQLVQVGARSLIVMGRVLADRIAETHMPPRES